MKDLLITGVIAALGVSLILAAVESRTTPPAPPFPLEVPPSGVADLVYTNSYIDFKLFHPTDPYFVILQAGESDSICFEAGYNYDKITDCPTNFYVFSLLTPTITTTNNGWMITFK